MAKRGKKLFDRDIILYKLTEIGEATVENLLNISYNFLITALDPPKSYREAMRPFDFPFELNWKEKVAWRTMISRLRRDGLIKKDGNRVAITKQGEAHVSRGIFKILYKPQKELDDDELILVIFDIPEHMRQWRDWLRFHLVTLGFHQLQKSVWAGKVALPEEFLKDIKTHKLFSYIHLLNVNKKGTLSSWVK